MNTEVALALAAGLITATGWVVNYILSARSDRLRLRNEAELKFIERQLVELYGPLYSLIFEGDIVFADLFEKAKVSGKYFFGNDRLPTQEQLELWQDWVTNRFFPHNNEIQKLITTKAHLIANKEMPDGFVEFLKHHVSWKSAHELWEKGLNPEYRGLSPYGNWPKSLDVHVTESFKRLKRRYHELASRDRVK